MTTTYVTACPVCVLAGGPFDYLAEAEQLAGTHDDLLHGGHPTTVVAARLPKPPGAPAGGRLIGGVPGSGKACVSAFALFIAAWRETTRALWTGDGKDTDPAGRGVA